MNLQDQNTVYFLGGIYPPELESEISSICGAIPQDSADALEKNIIQGLRENLQAPVRILNVYFLPAHARAPQKISGAQWESGGQTNISVPFFYCKGFQHFSKYFHLVKCMRACFQDAPQERIPLVIYSAYFPFLMAASKLKKKYPLDICLVVADLPEYMGLQSGRNLYHRLTARLSARLFRKNLHAVDRFVFLTEKMNGVLNTSGKPYTVMEGIANKDYVFDDTIPKEKKRVLYSGTLQFRYGIGVLLDAIRLIPDQDAEFVFYGLGEAKDAILAAAKTDKRIVYGGSIMRDVLFREQQAAGVLVNPRQNTGEFTKYSFPSKLIEYMLSGNPVVAYKLDGIPEEYDRFLLYPKDNSPQALAAALSKAIHMSPEDRKDLSEAETSFVRNTKNYFVQTRKIADLIIGR